MRKEIERLENELKMVSYHLTKGEQLEGVLQQTFKEIEDITDVRQMTNAQLKRIIQKIEVDKDGNVDIYLRLFGDLGLDETVLISSRRTKHKDITERLEAVDPALFAEVRQLLELNKAERHIRGGLATRRKYQTASGGIARAEPAGQTASGGQAAPGSIARQAAPGGIAQTSSAAEAERSTEIGNEDAGGG